SSTRQMDRLLPQITETISSQLGYYHVGIFLVDAHKEYAVLAAANSEGGQIMLARNHRLRIGETGIVGYVTQTGTPRIALDVGKDAAYFNNPDLPETHSEIALPLRSGADIMGALDVQSKVINAFNEEDINILSVLADQVSIAIQNARSFNESQEAREQAERSAAQLSEQQWNRFLKKDATPGFHFDGVTIRQVGPALNPQPAQMAIPIILRGVQIGTLKLSASDPNRKWDAHEIAIAEATADRAALAIEAARLLQDAQKRAAKERTIGNISARIGNLVNIDNIVQTTMQELGDTLPGTDVVIQFMSGQIRD
ncbi:MAG: GAF domain-containing protein, partial [Chloroflexi bacterium]